MTDPEEDSFMPLSKLHHWQPTADYLHVAARLLGFLRLLGIDKQPHYLEQALRVTPLPTSG